MCKYLVLLLAAPLMVRAQTPVQPVISTDYLALVADSALPSKPSVANGSTRAWHIKQMYAYNLPVKNIKLRDSTLSIIPLTPKYLTFGGSYTSAFATSYANAGPAIQNTYVQGRSNSGQLTWRGPETGEIYSYGPSLQSLEFNGSVYPYDANGRLVATGSGNGARAIAYNNSILRAGLMMRHSISLHSSIKHLDWQPVWVFALTASTAKETSVVQENNNTEQNFSASIEKNIKNISLSGRYSYFTSWYSNDNSNGFLNRTYQNSLLTPVSFNNAANTAAFSNTTDNPNFLLKDNGHSLQRTQQTGSFSINKETGPINFAAAWSADFINQNSDQSLKAGTAFFPAGLLYSRAQQDKHYTANGYISYSTSYSGSRFQSTARMNYSFHDDRTNINYTTAGGVYNYHRSATDASVSYNNTYDSYHFTAGLNAGNKLYQSSTLKAVRAFQPDISGFVSFPELIDYNIYLKLASSLTSFYSEPAINNSYAYYALTQFTPQNAFSFMPVTELQSFNNLSPTRHNEFTSKLEISYKYILVLTADMFIRRSFNDVFPVYNNGAIQLKNLADTRLRGWEITLQQNKRYWYGSNRLHLSNTLSFYTYNNIVTRVADGYNNTPVAGFATVHKAIVAGQPAGVIIGSTYLRNTNNSIVIGSNGYPLVNNNLSVIGNPVPDYTLKFSQLADWKAFSLNIDWEYQKGGDTWNGTQAVLDYYGRSARTAEERNIKNYVFDGALQNGSHNSIPVNFYSAALPVEQNRWVRYGYTGVAETYIQKADALRIRNISVAYTISFKKSIQTLKFTAYAENLIIWHAYKGADATQLLYDQPASAGIDFFNMPSVKNFGINVFIQF